MAKILFSAEKKFFRLKIFFIWDLEKFSKKIFDFLFFRIFGQNVEKMSFRQKILKKFFSGFFHLGLRKIFENFQFFVFPLKMLEIHLNVLPLKSFDQKVKLAKFLLMIIFWDLEKFHKNPN